MSTKPNENGKLLCTRESVILDTDFFSTEQAAVQETHVNEDETSKPNHHQYEQTKLASRVVTNHYLNEISDFGYWKCEAKSELSEAEATTRKRQGTMKAEDRIPLYTCVNVSDIKDIDASAETFRARVRLYCIWEVDFTAIGLEEWAEEARKAGHYLSLNDGQVDRALKIIPMPDVKFFNAIACERLDDRASLRVYGTHGGAVMWNDAFLCTFREHFELENFPFDKQDLTVELRLDNPRTHTSYCLFFVFTVLLLSLVDRNLEPFRFAGPQRTVLSHSIRDERVDNV